MPVWDAYAGPGLDEALASIASQDVPVSIVIVDNASTVPIGERPGVELVRSDVRLPLGSARNVGVARVRTPYVVVWDADDVMLPGTLRVLEDALERDRALAAFGAAILEWPSRVRHRWPRRWVATAIRWPALFQAVHCVWSIFPTTGSTIMRTALVRDAGGYEPAESGDDWVLGVALSFRGRFGWTERPGRLYRRHPNSVWARFGDERHMAEHARLVRRRLRADPASPRWIRASLPLVAAAQSAAIAFSRVRRRSFTRSGAAPGRAGAGSR